MEIYMDKPVIIREPVIIKQRRKGKAFYAEITPERHRKVKTIAASNGMTLKEWFNHLIDDMDEEY